MKTGPPRRGDVFAVRLGPTVGSEQSGSRPAIVVSNDDFNATLPLVTIVPLTTYRLQRTIYPSEALVRAAGTGLRADSVALAHQIRTIDRARLGRRIGRLTPESFAEIEAALANHLDLAWHGRGEP